MRHPFWILNSSLLTLVVTAIFFALITYEKPIELEEMSVTVPEKKIIRETPKINISKIYNYDLFNTYKKVERPVQQENYVTPLPEAPQQKKFRQPEPPKPQFLEPLNITLKGIIIVENESKNSVLIADNKTDIEVMYKVGDVIEDAKLIRIFPNKVLFIRSNGQQETLYLKEADAKKESSQEKKNDVEKIVKEVVTNQYIIDAQQFSLYVQNLAHCIDMFDLVPIYQQGTCVGIKVGAVDQEPLAQGVGLQSGDIITTINTIDTTTTENRILIYEKIISMNEGDEVSIMITRDNQTIPITYTIQAFGPNNAVLDSTKNEYVIETIKEHTEQEKEDILRKKHTFAPTTKEIKKHERSMLLERPKKSLNRIQNSVIE